MAYSVTRVLNFCYAHRIPNHPGKCRFLHGHNGRVEITLESETLNEAGVVKDFGEIRAGIEEWVNKELDHHVLLYKRDLLAQPLIDAGQQVVLMDGIPTAENIAALIFFQGRSMALNITRVAVWETEKNHAEFWQ